MLLNIGVISRATDHGNKTLVLYIGPLNLLTKHWFYRSGNRACSWNSCFASKDAETNWKHMGFSVKLATGPPADNQPATDPGAGLHILAWRYDGEFLQPEPCREHVQSYISLTHSLQHPNDTIQPMCNFIFLELVLSPNPVWGCLKSRIRLRIGNIWWVPSIDCDRTTHWCSAISLECLKLSKSSTAVTWDQHGNTVQKPATKNVPLSEATNLQISCNVMWKEK